MRCETQDIEVRGKILMDKYYGIYINFGVMSEHKVCLVVSSRQTNRFGALELEKNLSTVIIDLLTPPPRYDHDCRFNVFCCFIPSLKEGDN